VRLRDRHSVGTFRRRRRNGSGIFWTLLFLVAAGVAGGYLLVQQRLGNGIQIGRNVRTPTPQVVATPTLSVNDFLQQAQDAERRGDYRLAIESLDKASRRQPNDADLHRRAARLLVFIDQPEKAEQRARKALEIDPNHLPSKAVLCLAVEWQKRIKEAVDLCNEVVAADPKYSTGFAYLAEGLADSGDLPSARSAAETAIDLDPQNPDALRSLGYVYDVFGRYDDALYHYQRALERDPNMPHVMNSIGRIYLIQGNADNAIKTFQRVIEVDPGNDEAYFQVGGAYQFLGEFGKARVALDKAVELNPMRLKAWTRRGEILFAQRGYFEAIDDYKQAIAISQQLSQTLTPFDYLNLGFALQITQNCDQAIPYFNKVLELAPDDANLQESVGVGYRRCGR
jgi:tetratricopeptide (TPR) repeat protein